ncbi:MAG: class I SAM-dependent methyltransferase [Spirochaetales bacterium]|jgi:SAM-dependent methyltransferase|nr:class I SAM-dependent methyltransferase [Spirochaetales bacterium]
MAVGCLFYRIAIDPLLNSLRRDIEQLIPVNSQVLEIGSGTGSQAFLLTVKGRKVVGIDKNQNMTACAQKRARKRKFDEVEFFNTDASSLSNISDGQFMTATVTLAMHEMPHAVRKAVLKEMKRTAHTLIVADYSVPLPRNAAGAFVKLIECAAGGEHYAGFRDYQKRNGLLQLFSELGLQIVKSRLTLKKTVTIYVLSSSNTNNSTDDIPDSASL